MEEVIDESFFTDVAEISPDERSKTAFQEIFSPKQIGAITKYIEPVNGNMTLDYLVQMFKEDPSLEAVPVEDDTVVGIIDRATIESATCTAWKRWTSGNIIDYTERVTEILDANCYIENTIGQVSKINRETGTVFFPVFLHKVFYGIVSLYSFLDQTDKIRKQDLAKAQSIQQNFMSGSKFNSGSLRLTCWNRMANALGGDIYQAIQLSDTKQMVCCFDVSGKNVAAALLTIAVGSFFKMRLCNENRHDAPEKIIGMLDEFLESSMPVGNFITAAICIIDQAEKKVRLYNCGHTPVYIIIKDEGNRGKIATITATFPPLGMGTVKSQLENQSEDKKTGVATLPLVHNMHIELYSDGFTDMQNEDGVRYEDTRARNFFISLFNEPADKVSDTIQNEVDTWVGHAMLPDDITVLDLRL